MFVYYFIFFWCAPEQRTVKPQCSKHYLSLTSASLWGKKDESIYKWLLHLLRTKAAVWLQLMPAGRFASKFQATSRRLQTKTEWDRFSRSAKWEPPARLWIPTVPRMGSTRSKTSSARHQRGRWSTQMWRWVCAGTATYHLRTSGAV